jgi:hypothetical protein
MMATAYFAAKRRANGCPDSRSDSHNSGGRLGLGWCHLFRPTGMITCAIALPKARSRAKSASRTDQGAEGLYPSPKPVERKRRVRLPLLPIGRGSCDPAARRMQ